MWQWLNFIFSLKVTMKQTFTLYPEYSIYVYSIEANKLNETCNESVDIIIMTCMFDYIVSGAANS